MDYGLRISLYQSVYLSIIFYNTSFPALVQHGRKTEKEELYLKMASKYKECMEDMSGRAPGSTSIGGTQRLDPSKPNGYQIPFNPKQVFISGVPILSCM